MVVAVKRDVGVLQDILTKALQAILAPEGFALPDDPATLTVGEAARLVRDSRKLFCSREWVGEELH